MSSNAVGPSVSFVADHFLRTILSSSSDFIVLVDPDGAVTHLSSQAAQLLDESISGIADKRLFQLLGGDSPKTDAFGLLEQLRASQVLDSVMLRGKNSGFVRVRALPVTRDDGVFLGGALVSKEPPGLEEAEEMLEKAMQDLSRLSRETDEFAYMVGHELSAPLRTIVSYAKRLSEDERGDEGNTSEKQASLERVLSGCGRLQDTILALLQYSRLATRGGPSEEFGSEALVYEVLNDFTPELRSVGAQVLVKSLPAVKADPLQMKLLIQHIIGNAIKFRGPSPLRIDIDAREDESHRVISIRDNGIGFEPQHADRIFRMFHRLHGRSEYPGLGVGLAVCKRIVERQRGQIWAEAPTDGGAVFHVSLPKPK